MARFYLEDFINYNNVRDIVAVTWQVAMDEEFKTIIDETIFDRENILEWTSSLNKLGTNLPVNENDDVYVRVKYYTNNGGKITESDWYMAEEIPNNNNEVTLTYKGKDVAVLKINDDGTYDMVL